MGKKSELLTPHERYLALGKSRSLRLANYQAWFNQPIETEILIDIRRCVQSGLAIGNVHFKEQIEQLTGLRVSARKRGRPKVEAVD
ncbi:MAG: hypothetical protein BWK79_16290 [Beggiatoa sp. IS2]|nr:MAG: hypothetical protein BWK79_16290 [Beggiatoa sp. IS2]